MDKPLESRILRFVDPKTPQYQLPKSYTVQVNLRELYRVLRYKREDMIGLFVISAINLKTEVNRAREKLQCVKTGEKFNAKDVPLGKLNRYVFLIIGTLKVFIDKYTDKFGPDLKNGLYQDLMDRKAELYFTGINVSLDDGSCDDVDRIIDALTVKFYQQLIYDITIYFSLHKKAFIINFDQNTNTYIFKFRDYNIMELAAVEKGQIPFNLQE